MLVYQRGSNIFSFHENHPIFNLPIAFSCFLSRLIEPTKHSPSSPSEESTFLLENSSTSAAETRCQSAILICVLGFQLRVIISACDSHNSPNQLVKLSLGEHTKGRGGEGTPRHCTLHHIYVYLHICIYIYTNHKTRKHTILTKNHLNANKQRTSQRSSAMKPYINDHR